MIEDVDLKLEIGRSWFFNHEIPIHVSGMGYVRTVPDPFRWTEESAGMQVLDTEGRVTRIDPKQNWMFTITHGTFSRPRAGRSMMV
jgi:hypothetical protein